MCHTDSGRVADGSVMAVAEGAVEGDRLGPHLPCGVEELPPALVGVKRARCWEAQVTIALGAAFQLTTRAKPSHCLQRVG